MKTLTSLLTAALLTTAVGTAAMASSDRAIPAETQAKITEKLKGEGYDVRQIKSEDGMIEVYALKDGQRLELYLDQNLNVTRTKVDD